MTDTTHIPILTIRGQRVILDADLARLYGVETRQLNQAVKRNRNRFPKEFCFKITPDEQESLRSQIVTSNVNSTKHVPSAVTAGRRGGVRYLPHAFTEHEALQASNVLNSPEAVKMSVFIIRAFVKMRDSFAANAAILQRLAEIDKTLLVHDQALRDVYQKLLPLLTPAPEKPKRRIGFHLDPE